MDIAALGAEQIHVGKGRVIANRDGLAISLDQDLPAQLTVLADDQLVVAVGNLDVQTVDAGTLTQ